MTVAEFIAKISLDSTKFTEGTNKVKRDVASLKGEIGKFAPALAGAFTVAGLVGLGKKAIETGAHFYDMAQLLGVSLESVQKMDFAAKQAGVDVERLGRALLKIQGELRSGGWNNKIYADALNTLNLKPGDLLDKTPEKMLLTLADAFGKVSERGEANAAIISLVGIKMAGIIPILARGKAGLEEMFGRTPVAADEAILAMKQLQQQMVELGRVSFPVLAKFVSGFAFIVKGVVGVGAAIKATGGILGAVFELIRHRSLRGFREDITKIEDDLYKAFDNIFRELEKPVEGKTSFNETGELTAEQQRHKSKMENLDAELAHLLEINRIAGQTEEKELEERKARLKELDDEYARLEQQPRTMERDEEMKQSDVAYLKQVNAIAELEQRIARQKQEAAEALAKKTQDVEDARFQNSLILMTTEEKRLALLQREQELVQQITKLREGGMTDAAMEREKDLESLRAEQLRLDKKDEQTSAGGQPFSVFTNELQRRGGAGAAVVGYGGSEVLNIAKQQLEAQKRIDANIKLMNDRLAQGFNITGAWA
jgi:hypothetical protein